MKSIYHSNLFLFFVMIFSILGSFMLMTLPEKVSDMISQYVLLFIPVMIYLFVTKKDMKKTLRLNKISFKNVSILIFIAIFMQPFIIFMAMIAGMVFGNQLDFLFEGMEIYPLFFYLFIVAVTPAICEELVMRGVMLDAYAGMNIKKAAIMNGFLFGIFHMNLHQFTYTFFMGVLLAYVVYITNSIYASMLIHFVHNSLSVLSERFQFDLFFPVEGLMNNFGENIGMIVMLILVVLSVVITTRLVKYLIKINNKDMDEIDINMKEQKLFNWPIAASTFLFLASSACISLMQFLQKFMEYAE